MMNYFTYFKSLSRTFESNLVSIGAGPSSLSYFKFVVEFSYGQRDLAFYLTSAVSQRSCILISENARAPWYID